jgi:hypothetical protein
VVTEEKMIPLLCFMGDTKASVYLHHPSIISSTPVLFTECTLLEDNGEVSVDRGHTSWPDLEPIVRGRLR